MKKKRQECENFFQPYIGVVVVVGVTVAAHDQYQFIRLTKLHPNHEHTMIDSKIRYGKKCPLKHSQNNEKKIIEITSAAAKLIDIVKSNAKEE